MPYYLEEKNNKYKLHLKDDPTHIFSKKYKSKKDVIKQMQAIEISKKQRNKNKLVSGGIFNLIGKVKNSVQKIIKTVKSVPTNIISSILPGVEKYTRKAKSMLERYGKMQIMNMTLRREPVDKKVMLLAGVMSDFEIQKLMNKEGIDKLYHLSMVCEVIDYNGNSVLIVIEKNDVINIDIVSKLKTSNEMQLLNVDLEGKKINIYNLLEKTRLAIGNNKYFVYDSITANCGIFIIDILKSNGLYNELYHNFLYQVPYNNKDISDSSRRKMSILTKLGSYWSHLKGGSLIKFI